MNLSPEIIVVGLNVIDVLVQVPAVVRANEKHEVANLVIGGGAPAGNAACVMAALGRRVAFITRLGDNTLSQISRTELVRFGVLPDGFINDPDARPAVAVVEIHPDTGDRTVFYSLAGYRNVTAADVRADLVQNARLVLVDSYQLDAAREMLCLAQTHGVRSVLDLESGPPETLRELIAMGTDVILPKATAITLSGETNIAAILTALTRITTGTVVVTDGIEGSWASGPEGTARQKAFKVKALDTTGCGDAYHGAYAAAMLDGLPLRQRMEFAAYIAAQVATGFGGRGDHLPTRDSLRTADLTQLSPELRASLTDAE